MLNAVCSFNYREKEREHKNGAIFQKWDGVDAYKTGAFEAHAAPRRNARGKVGYVLKGGDQIADEDIGYE